MTHLMYPVSLFILVFASIIIIPMVRYLPIRQLDEGFYAYPAYLIYDGEHPYRDFYLGYTPGKTYLLAFLFKLFGPSLVIARYYYAAVTIFLAVEVVWLTYLIIPNPMLAGFSGVLFILSLFPRRELYYVTAVETGMFSDRTAISLFVMITAIIATNLQSQPLFFLTGTLLTLTLFFAQEAGIWASVSVILYFFLNLPEEWQVSGLSLISGAVTLGVFLSVLALTAGVPFKRFLNECFKEILVLGTGHCRRPYPSLFSTLPWAVNYKGLIDFKKNRSHFFIHYLRYYLPLFFFLAVLFITASDFSHGGLASLEGGVILPLVYGVFASYFIYSWPDYSHVVRGLPVHIPVALFALSRMYEKLMDEGGGFLSTEGLSYGFLVALLGIILLYDIFHAVRTLLIEVSERKNKVLLETNADIYLEKNYHGRISSLIEKMRLEVSVDEKILALPADPLICFLMQQKTKVYLKSFLPFNPTHYHKQAVSVLKAGELKWIVYNREQDGEDFFPKGATFPGYAQLVYKQVEREYTKAFELDGYDVYRKN